MKIELRRFHSKDFYKLTAIIDKDTAIKAGLAWPFDRESAMSFITDYNTCLLYTSPSPRDVEESRMPSSA